MRCELSQFHWCSHSIFFQQRTKHRSHGIADYGLSSELKVHAYCVYNSNDIESILIKFGNSSADSSIKLEYVHWNDPSTDDFLDFSNAAISFPREIGTRTNIQYRLPLDYLQAASAYELFVQYTDVAGNEYISKYRFQVSACVYFCV